ncbi:MAG: aminotransferase class I/II-fold pyridoxal phosphate-dependent enzyme [Acidimicrobiales bacterium]|nr:aminotransferase class I/II-fold pyridoxal phosphate-dependent enzyme [Actinomycetota bacterium]
MTIVKHHPEEFALLGATPTYADPVPVGQLYFPTRERFHHDMRQLFDSGWFTNHGPRSQQLEARLADLFGVDHVIVVTNATLGLAMVAVALGLHGNVVVPSFTFAASAQAITWAGVTPRFCDADPVTHQVTADTVAAAIDTDTSAVLAVNLWGGTCEPQKICDVADEHGLPVFFDSAHGVGVQVDGRALGSQGIAQVFSFHATKILSAGEGGCICTNDGHLAGRLRNIRSSYGAGSAVPVPVTSNGRFSEAQAVLALASLDDLPNRIAHNQHIWQLYRGAFEDVPGVHLVDPAGADRSNYQYAVVEVDAEPYGLGRDELVNLLRAEGILARRYFYPGVHRLPPYRDQDTFRRPLLPGTDQLTRTVLQLPIGALVSDEVAETIGALVADAHDMAPALRIPSEPSSTRKVG